MDMQSDPNLLMPDGGICAACGFATATLALATCPECGGVVKPSASNARGGQMRYQNAYVWFVFVSALDIMLTWAILQSGGSEVNPIADAVIQRFGLQGMVAFKFALVIFVIIMCEWLGRRSDKHGRKIAEWAVAITSIPVVLSFVMLIAASF
ncbi:MAG: hypothetical protein DHS20C16_28420 [Phycisphaerae bacterium]|nr:MAG: hypothetical protein DHS20C16_28420 [Phycisphaerae bacterium]